MEKDKFKKGISDVNNIKLSSVQKTAILSRLDSYIENNPAPKEYISEKSEWYSRIEVLAFSSRFAYVLASFVVIVLTGTGAMSGAEKSLPGDNLYSIKVNVIEPLRFTMAVGQVAKANVESDNMTERLIEAETLATQGRLTESSQQEIEDRVKKHADSFNALVLSTEVSNATTSDRSLAASLDARVDFEARINAHTKVLEKLEQKPKSNSNGGNVSKLKSVLAVEAQKFNKQVENQNADESIAADSPAPTMMMFSATLSQEASNSPATDTEVQNTAKKSVNVDEKSSTSVKSKEEIKSKNAYEAKKKETERLIRNIKTRIEKNKKSNSKISQEILEDSNQALMEAESSLSEAIENEKSGDVKTAISNLINSRRSAKEASTSLEASQKIDMEDSD